MHVVLVRIGHRYEILDVRVVAGRDDLAVRRLCKIAVVEERRRHAEIIAGHDRNILLAVHALDRRRLEVHIVGIDALHTRRIIRIVERTLAQHERLRVDTVCIEDPMRIRRSRIHAESHRCTEQSCHKLFLHRISSHRKQKSQRDLIPRHMLFIIV